MLIFFKPYPYYFFLLGIAVWESTFWHVSPLSFESYMTLYGRTMHLICIFFIFKKALFLSRNSMNNVLIIKHNLVPYKQKLHEHWNIFRIDLFRSLLNFLISWHDMANNSKSINICDALYVQIFVVSEI